MSRVPPGAWSILGHPAGTGKQVVPPRLWGCSMGCRGHRRGARGLSDEGRVGGIFIFIACLSAGPGGVIAIPGM